MNRELIKNFILFYCIRGPFLHDLLYTIIIWTGIAVFLMATGLRRAHIGTVIVCLSIGLCLFITRRTFFRLFKPRRILSLVAAIVTSIFLGVCLGYLMGGIIFRLLFSAVLKPNLPHVFVFFLVYVSAVTTIFYLKYQLGLSREATEQERIERLSVEKEALESKLRLLQAQIEPHFLFNTLSNTISLIDTDPAKSKSMLGDLVCYLRTSLSRTLPAATTLGQEIDIIKAYLNIQKIRMSERLSFSIDIPYALSNHPLPPMLIQPLVENAVKHGLEPNIDGGKITIKALAAEGLVRIEVTDTGNGFSPCHETGVGIGNVMERIRLLYGEKGRLILEENRPKGVKAVIEIPNDL